MGTTVTNWAADCNKTVYIPGQPKGHYESFFLRANHPVESKAFWIRYTIFSPQGHPEKAIGELWSVFFDAEAGTNTAVKREVPFGNCSFSRSALDVKIDTAVLSADKLNGNASAKGHEISWDLSYSGGDRPLFLLPLKMYSAGFPKAKALVPLPMAVFNGSLIVDGKKIDIRDWKGSQDHLSPEGATEGLPCASVAPSGLVGLTPATWPGSDTPSPCDFPSRW